MRGVQFKKNGNCLFGILLVFMCISLFSSFLSFGDTLIIHCMPPWNSSCGLTYSHSTEHDFLFPITNRRPYADKVIHFENLSQSGQDLLKFGKMYHTVFFYIPICKSAIGLFCLSRLSAIFFIPGFNHHFIIPHSIHAPPLHF